MKVTGTLLTEVRDNRQVDKVDNLHITKKLRQNKAETFLYIVSLSFCSGQIEDLDCFLY